jgi:hypothetical protein
MNGDWFGPGNCWLGLCGNGWFGPCCPGPNGGIFLGHCIVKIWLIIVI